MLQKHWNKGCVAKTMISSNVAYNPCGMAPLLNFTFNFFDNISTVTKERWISNG